MDAVDSYESKLTMSGPDKLRLSVCIVADLIEEESFITACQALTHDLHATNGHTEFTG